MTQANKMILRQSFRLKTTMASAVEATHALRVQLLTPAAKAPSRGSPHAAGYDLYAAEDVTILNGSRQLVHTQIAVEIPTGYYGRVAPRSGLAVKSGIDVGAGVIDCDYRGEVGVLLFNHGHIPCVIEKGDRIAQLILEKIITPEVVVVEALTETQRQGGGFGSTGK